MNERRFDANEIFMTKGAYNGKYWNKLSVEDKAYFVQNIKKMLDDKRAIHQHLANGGKITDLKDKYQFLDPLSIYKPE